MKNTAIKAILILISAICFAGFTACGVSTDSSMETNYAENVNKKAVKAFKEAKLIKVGEHTYYPDYLFESDDSLRIIFCLFSRNATRTFMMTSSFTSSWKSRQRMNSDSLPRSLLMA